MTFETILAEKRGRVGIVTFNRSKALNALNSQVTAELAAALEVAGRADMEGKTFVIIIPSFAERYLSTALFEGL